VSLSTYNGNLSGYDNVKSNVVADKMAKNRWGSKFKRLYNPLRNANNQVDFTQGMLNCAGTDVMGIIEELEDLRDALNSFFKLSDNSTAKPNSYFNLLCSSTNHRGGISPVLKDIKLSLSLPLPASTDQRKISKFFQRATYTTTATSYLEPIDSYFRREELVNSSNVFYGKIETDSNTEKPFYSKNQLSLTVADGTEYGHIEASYILAPNTNFNNSFDLYGVEEDHTLFLNNFNYENEFSKLFTDFKLEKWLLDFATYSYSFEQHRPSYSSNISIMFGADLVLAWVNENLSSWYAYLNSIDNERAGVELELIEHLNLCEMLQEQIGGNAGKISSIWFEFKKEVSPPLVREGLEIYYQENYEWWLEEQFDEIRKKFKNFHLYCNYDAGSYVGGIKRGGGTPPSVTLKSEAFTLSGSKIYWLVTALLNIGSRAKKRSFLERLFSMAMFVVAIYLTVVSANPAWIKMVLIISIFASSSGALGPKAQLALAAVMFVYGLSNTNFTAMSSAQLFSFAVNNIEMVFKMVQLYDAVKLEDETKKEEEIAPHEVQEEAMQFIYSDAYSQYDNFYSVMYDYEPKYKKY